MQPKKKLLNKPIRTCVGCGERRPQPTLHRLALTPEGHLVPSRTLVGRGAWLCRDKAEDCLSRAKQSRGFSRTLRAPIAHPVSDADWVDLHRMIATTRSVSSRRPR